VIRKDTYRNRLFSFLKLLLGGLFLWYVLHVLRREDIGQLWALGSTVCAPEKRWMIGVVLLLMPVNLLLEAIKWKRLLKLDPPMGWWWSLRAVSTGLTIGLFTPSRLGEFGGRIMYVQKRWRMAALWATLLSSFGQLVVLFCAGMLLSPRWLVAQGYLGDVFLVWGSVVGALLALGFLWFFLKSDALATQLIRLRLSAFWRKKLTLIRRYSAAELREVLLFSGLRLVSYNLQLCLLWLVFDLQISFGAALLLSPLLFFFQAGLPGFVLTDLGVRGSIALFLLADYADSAWQLVLPSYSLWLLNVILPALLGWVSLWFLKWRDVVD